MQKRPNRPNGPSSKNRSTNQNKAIELISHYTTLLRANRAPNLQTIIDNYDGQKADIEEDIRFAAFLEEMFRKGREELNKYLKPENLEKAKNLMRQIASEIRKKKGLD